MFTKRLNLDVLVLVVIAARLLASTSLAIAQTYTGIDLYVLHSPTADFIQFQSGAVSLASGGQVVGYIVSGPLIGSLGQDALVWMPPSGAVTDLTPVGFNASPYGTDGMQQVGQSGHADAYLWRGTAASAVDLQPTNLTGIAASIAYGVHGNEQVGAGYTNVSDIQSSHALLWHSAANSAVDLHPTNLNGIQTSGAVGTDGVHQVGSGYGPGTSGEPHALLWNETAASAVDLNPTNLVGYSDSFAVGVNGTQQVGSGAGSATGGNLHALLWNGTADSAVDLNPTGSVTSTAYATNGTHQVGISDFGATFWSGAAASAIDLNSLLPFTSQLSDAYSIDAQGNVWGTAIDLAGNIHAVEWSPVPEPAAWSLFATGALGLLAYQRCFPRR